MGETVSVQGGQKESVYGTVRTLDTLRPALTQYNQLAKEIRDKTKERRSLLSEKKALSAVHVFRHRELAAKITALTEDLEELRSEKNLLLASL